MSSPSERPAHAFVTGATSGLGRRFAQVLANAGAHVVVTGRRVERLDELVAEIAAAGGHSTSVSLERLDHCARQSFLKRRF